MRTIKFRAWDKDEKKMMVPAQIEWRDGQIFRIDDGHDWVIARAYELMQFTGILDKNEKEIYEGDILQSKAKTQEGIVYVVFDEGSFWFMWDKDNGFTYDWLVRNQGEKFSFEVTGNIYENPALLNPT